jgi:hypothetical protein
MSKNSLNIELFGANPFMCESLIKQSNEKNDSLGALTLFDAENILVKLAGRLILKDNEAVINCM